MRNKILKLFTWIMLLAFITSFSIGSLSMRGISTAVDDSSFSVSSLSTQDTFWPGNSSEWTEIAPENQGLNSSKIAEMFKFIKDNSIGVHSIIITRNGYLTTLEYFHNSEIYRNLDGTKTYFGGQTIHPQFSTTKSLTSILIGIALQEGFLDNINQTLYEFFAHIWDPSFANSTLKQNITIEQLLTMNSGLGGPNYPHDGADAKIASDCIKFALEDVPLAFTPGEAGEFEYGGDGPNLLSGIITNVTGKSTEEFAKEYLFTPLGILEDEYYWDHDAQNISYGGSGFECTPKVQAKLGILCLNNGTWNGTQIVDIDYMKDATTTKMDFPEGFDDYGYLWWIMNGSIDGYYAAGWGGQSIYVIPEYNIVVGFTGFVSDGDYETLLSDYILQFVEPPPILNITTVSPTTNFNINLTWTAYPRADNYTLYRHTSQITSTNLISATEVKTIMGTSTTDTVPGPGRWYYAIVANNETGSSYPSNSPYIDVQEPDPEPGSEKIPGYDVFLLFGVIGFISAIIVKIIRRKINSKNK